MLLLQRMRRLAAALPVLLVMLLMLTPQVNAASSAADRATNRTAAQHTLVLNIRWCRVASKQLFLTLQHWSR